jgi:hypothetical protein
MDQKSGFFKRVNFCFGGFLLPGDNISTTLTQNPFSDSHRR